ncbi:MAG: AarF/ABC1/UbiB kinase family protein [Deltaproteobacteria bacterium]|nr:AarF/ABC1/UbiB kinase family protein [Deltaproteobacteria bacterium]
MAKNSKTGLISRSLSLAKITASATGRIAKHTVSGWFSDPLEHLEKGKRLLESQAKQIVGEANQLRGTLVKAGQILSMYGDSFFPKEVLIHLKKLQSEVEPLPLETIDSLLRKRLGLEKYHELDIDPIPLGAASLGQVHRAVIKKTGQQIALKIRYPGIERAIDTDLKLLRFFLTAGKFFPADIPKERWDGIFDEAKQMLYQEVDYKSELRLLKVYQEHLLKDPRYHVPQAIERYCTPSVLCTSFETGVRIDSLEVKALSQERRDQLAGSFVDLFLMEFYEWNLVQTDPHFGNYLIRLNPDGHDQWVLFDFGALRTFSNDFKASYIKMVSGILNCKDEQILESGELMGIVSKEDSPQARQGFVKLAYLSAEPVLSNKEYDWANSQLPKRTAALSLKVIPSLKFRIPPKEMLSLNRKLGGIYVHLAELRSTLAIRKHLTVEPYQSLIGIGPKLPSHQ